MKTLLLSVKDHKLGAFGPIFQCRTEGEAMRHFTDAINDPQNKAMYNHPDDYDLFVLGGIEDSTGAITQPSPVYSLAEGKNVKIRNT